MTDIAKSVLMNFRTFKNKLGTNHSHSIFKEYYRLQP